MYSAQNNSFMGGGSQPPPFGPQPTGMYGQNPQQQQQYGQQPGGYGQQGGGFINAQPTGFPGQGMQSLQAQATGYPGMPQQQQQQFGAGGYGSGGQQPPQQQPGPVSQSIVSSFSQPPQQQQQSAAPQIAQLTGMTSSQMADSFRSSASRRPAPVATRVASSKIPNIRLSFITASDQAKFEQLFKSAVPDGQAMSGDQAKELLVRSKLTGEDLALIWFVLSSVARDFGANVDLGLLQTRPSLDSSSSRSLPWPCISAI
jgi:actin cytoskeleton-regulatory complex protein PAN1